MSIKREKLGLAGKLAKATNIQGWAHFIPDGQAIVEIFADEI